MRLHLRAVLRAMMLHADMRKPSAGPVVRTLAIGLVALFAVAQDAPQPRWVQAMGYRPDEVFPITVGKYGYPYVIVQINGRKIEMAFDTANMTGLAVSTAIAEQLNLTEIGSSASRDTDGRVLGRQRVFQASEVVALDEMWPNQRVYELVNATVDGLWGPRFLLGKRFTLDYRNRVLAISKSPLPAGFPTSGSLQLFSQSLYAGMVVVSGIVNGREVLIQIDTGKSRTCVTRELAAALQLPKTKDGYRIDEVRLGPFTFAVPSAKEVGSFEGISGELPKPILLGIGSDILSQIVLTVDYPGQRLLISK